MTISNTKHGSETAHGVHFIAHKVRCNGAVGTLNGVKPNERVGKCSEV